MTDEHAALTAEYERLVKAFEPNPRESEWPVGTAILHILKRLGPPTADEAADVHVFFADLNEPARD